MADRHGYQGFTQRRADLSSEFLARRSGGKGAEWE